MPKKINLTGQKFGRLKVLYEAEPHYTSGGNKKVMWLCKCDCGVKKEIHSGDLLSGKTISCGCYNYEKNFYSKHKQLCKYEFPEDKDYCIGYTAKGHKFIIDKEDYKLVSQYNWNLHHGYFYAHIPMSNPRRSIYIHRLVMGLADTKYDYTIDVDHIKTEHKWDNRKCNLRIVTKRENNINHNLTSKNNSGITGVYFHKKKNNPNDKGRWRVRFNIKPNKQKNFDCHSKEEAINLRKRLENEYYGEYSYANSQKIATQFEIKEEIE